MDAVSIATHVAFMATPYVQAEPNVCDGCCEQAFTPPMLPGPITSDKAMLRQ